MLLKNTPETYGLISQIFHWITAVLIIALLAMGLYMHGLPQTTTAQIADKVWLYSLHKTLGMTAFAVALLRVMWAVISVKPGLLNADHKAESLLAEVIHWVLYGGILIMPLTGYLHHAASVGFAPIWWPFGQDLPFIPKDRDLAHALGVLHDLVGKMILASVFLHASGAMKHFVIDRDQTLHRMIPFWYRGGADVKPDHGSRALSVTVAVAAYCVAGFVAFMPASDPASGMVMSDAGQDGRTAAVQVAADMSQDYRSGQWVVDQAQSQLQIRIIQMGAAVSGEFGQWSAEIVLDPQALEQASIRVTVDVGSLSLGEVTGNALDADFLNAAAFPTAIYTSSVVREVAPDQYEADGTLTLRGIDQPVQLAFNLVFHEMGDQAIAKGTARLSRLDFSVGAETQKTEETVGFGVDVLFDVIATKS